MMQGSLTTKLRVLRAERGFTLREAERLTGVDKDTLSKLERGLRHPHDVTLSRIAKGYGIPVEELLEEPAVPLAEGGVPDSLDELLERRGARTRHLVDENLPGKLRQAPLEEAIRIAEEVYAEVEAISPDLVRLRDNFRHDTKAMLLLSEVVKQRLRVRYSLAIKQGQKFVPVEPEVEPEAEAESEATQTLRKFEEQDLVLGSAVL